MYPDPQQPGATVLDELTRPRRGYTDGVAPAPGPAVRRTGRWYRNPLKLRIPGGGLVESCADPTVIKGQQPGDPHWYLFGTSDPLNGDDWRERGGRLRLMPTFRSLDLVEWTYMGDVFDAVPSWVAPSSGLWAPEITYFDGLYHLYYAAFETSFVGGGSAVGVATSPDPLGPWTDSGEAVVEPHGFAADPAARRWVIDPEIVVVGDDRYIFYGSFYGGISARRLSADGRRSDPATEIPITIANRYEAPEVIQRDGHHYLFVSATDCCNGPLTGYSVFVGRSEHPLGPYVDRDGNSLLEPRVGRTPVVAMNGNRWVGTGHNSVFRDHGGQWWMFYHAVDRFDPYFAGTHRFTKRPVLLDPLDWIDGWPILRGGRGASDRAMPAPAAQAGQRSGYRPDVYLDEVPGDRIPSRSDEFDGRIGGQWMWVREPAPDAYAIEDGALRLATHGGFLSTAGTEVPVLLQPAPAGNYIVDVRVRLDVPEHGVHNFAQAGLVIYHDDERYLKLVHVAYWETRQVEFGKRTVAAAPGLPHKGLTVVGPPGEWTYLRVLKRTVGGEEHYTAYSSNDGDAWVRGATWTHELGPDARIGLVAMGAVGYTAHFDYVRVSRVKGRPPR